MTDFELNRTASLSNMAASPPRDLRRVGRKLWNDLQATYEFDAAETLLLLELCRTADLLEALSDHEDLPEGRQQRIVFARLHAALRLPDVADGLKRPERRPVRGTHLPYKVAG
jgi:hypothetical protein